MTRELKVIMYNMILFFKFYLVSYIQMSTGSTESPRYNRGYNITYKSNDMYNVLGR